MESFDEKLIELVKEKPQIYDLTQREYRNVYKKEKIWKEIGEKLNCNPEKCKKRWKGLRDTFKRNKKMSLLPSGSAAPEADIKWKYYSHLSFLNDCEGYRRTVSNDTGLNEYAEDSIENLEEYLEDDMFCDSPSDLLLSSTPRAASTSNVQSTAGTAPTLPSRIASTAKNKEKTQFQDFLSSATEAIKVMKDNEGTYTELLFLALARKIDGADIAIEKKNMLETKVMALVYETLQKKD